MTPNITQTIAQTLTQNITQNITQNDGATATVAPGHGPCCA